MTPVGPVRLAALTRRVGSGRGRVAGTGAGAGAILRSARLLGIVRLEALVLAVVLVVAAAYAVYDGFARLHPTDAFHYLWAAERLNAGHELYRLSPGDHPVWLNPPYWTVPLVSPPLIAVLWRPLALLSDGILVWYVLVWSCVLGTAVYVARRRGVVGAIALVMLAGPIGHQLVVGNVNGLFVAGIAIAWLARRDDRVGLLVGAMVAIKLTPAVLVTWLVGQRRWRAAGFAIAAMAIGVFVGVVGAGLEATLEYPAIAASTIPSEEHPAAALGLPFPMVIAVAGAAATVLLRDARVGFTVALATMVFGSPAFYQSSLVLLLPAAVALLPWQRPPPR